MDSPDDYCHLNERLIEIRTIGGIGESLNLKHLGDHNESSKMGRHRGPGLLTRPPRRCVFHSFSPSSVSPGTAVPRGLSVSLDWVPRLAFPCLTLHSSTPVGVYEPLLFHRWNQPHLCHALTRTCAWQCPTSRRGRRHDHALPWMCVCAGPWLPHTVLISLRVGAWASLYWAFSSFPSNENCRTTKNGRHVLP